MMWRASKNIIQSIKCGSQNGGVKTLSRRMSTKPESGAQPSLKTPIAPVKKPPVKPPPPPPTQERGGGFFKFFGVTLLGFGIGSGGIVGYAWYNKNFKKQMEKGVPYAREMFELIFPYLPNSPSETTKGTGKSPLNVGIVSDPEKVKQQGLWKRREAIAPQVTGNEPTVSDAVKTSSIQETNVVKADVALPDASQTEIGTTPETKQVRDKDQQLQVTKQRIEEKALEEAMDNAALESMLSEALSEAEKCCQEAAELHSMASQQTQRYTDTLKAAMEDSSKVDKSDDWNLVSEACDIWKAAETQASNQAVKARESLEKLRYFIEDGKKGVSTKQNKVLITTQEKLNNMSYDLNTQVTKYTKVVTEANVMKQFKELAEKGKEQFKKELESILPDVSLGDSKARGKGLTEDELNSLIAHAHRRIEQLQRQLAVQQAGEQQRLQVALEKQIEQDELTTQDKLDIEIERKRNQWNLDQQKHAYEAQIAFERELRRELALQAGAHSEHIQDVLRVQADELDKTYAEKIQECIISERNNFSNEVGDAMARLQGIEAAVEARAETEKRGRKAQELWLSCQALLEAIHEGKKNAENWEDQIFPLANVLTSVREAGDNHPFVNMLISSFPDAASQTGVWTEAGLRQRFVKVRKVCKRVGMMDDEMGGTLFKYFLSYLQSFLVFNSVAYKSPEDCVDLEELDTYELLTHAAHYLNNGDLENATRFMNQLKGEPRQVASDWIREARLLLETRQIASALNAHASACGLGTLF